MLLTSSRSASGNICFFLPPHFPPTLPSLPESIRYLDLLRCAFEFFSSFDSLSSSFDESQLLLFPARVPRRLATLVIAYRYLSLGFCTSFLVPKFIL